MKVIKFFKDGSFLVSEMDFVPEGYHPIPKEIEKYKFFLFENGKVLVDIEKEKREKITNLNTLTKQYVTNFLHMKDWGSAYEECLSELQNTAISTETKILYFLKPKIPNLTLTQIRENIALYIAGQKTQDQIIQELQTAGLTQAEIDQYFELLSSAVEVAKLINWIEQVWDYEEQIEQQINNAKDIEELQQIMNNIQFPSLE